MIIFGFRRTQKNLGFIVMPCTNCANSTLALFKVTRWFALFFIPIIPINTKYLTVCTNCKRQDQTTKEQVDALRQPETAPGVGMPPAPGSPPAPGMWSPPPGAASGPTPTSAPAPEGWIPPPGTGPLQ